MYLCVDVGGTHITLGLKKQLSEEFTVIEKIEHKTNIAVSSYIISFLKKQNLAEKDIVHLAICYAGISLSSQRDITKRSIDLDEEKVSSLFTQVSYLNDVEAMAYALPILKESQLLTIARGEKDEHKRRIIINSGTGFGLALLTCIDEEIIVLSSESGHSEFPFRGDEIDFLSFSNEKSITHDELLSGPGIEKLYHYFQSTQYQEEIPSLTANQVSKTYKSNPCSKKVFEAYFKFLGRACRDFTLDFLSFDGLYLAGGVIQKNFSEELKQVFITSFLDSDHYRDLLKKTQIHLINDYYVNLHGLSEYVKNSKT